MASDVSPMKMKEENKRINETKVTRTKGLEFLNSTASDNRDSEDINRVLDYWQMRRDEFRKEEILKAESGVEYQALNKIQ